MVTRTLPRWAWSVAAVLLGAAGCAWLAQADLATRGEAFDTDARIVHRLLSQQAAQHDAVLATLALLQPGTGAATATSAEQPSATAGWPLARRGWRRPRPLAP